MTTEASTTSDPAPATDAFEGVEADVQQLFQKMVSSDSGVNRVVEQVRKIATARGVTPTERALIAQHLKSGTGLSLKDLGLPKAVDVEALAERKAREKEMDGNVHSEVVDPDDQLDMADRFLRSTADHEGMAEIVRNEGEFLRATPSHYEPMEREAVRRATYNWLESKRGLKDGEFLKPNRADAENFEDAVKAQALVEGGSPSWISDAPKGFADPTEIIAFRNGLLNSRTREFHPPTRRLLNRNALPFDFDPNAPKPLGFFKFLCQLFPGDSESIGTLQEFLGLFLTADTRFQKALFIKGPKRSGKGTLGRVIRGVVGEANVCAPTLAGLGTQFGLQTLLNKRVAIVSDARIDRRADVGACTENLLRISGEDAISVPRKFVGDWTGKLRIHFLLLGSGLPAFTDASGALANRFIVLGLKESFLGREDHGLSDRLLSELPGITNWALAGLARLRARGRFIQPESSRELVHQMEALASQVASFVAERCELAPAATVPCAALYQAWVGWAGSQGREHMSTIQIFGRDLSEAFPSIRVTQPRIGGRQVRHYEGIRLTDTH